MEGCHEAGGGGRALSARGGGDRAARGRAVGAAPAGRSPLDRGTPALGTGPPVPAPRHAVYRSRLRIRWVICGRRRLRMCVAGRRTLHETAQRGSALRASRSRDSLCQSIGAKTELNYFGDE